jgi:hypothetical protein
MSYGMASPMGGGDKIPKGYKQGQLQQFNPQQMQLFSQLFGNVGPDSYLSKLAGGDQAMFDQIEAPAHRQFQGQIGQLASRFSGMGTGGRHSSGFQNAGSAAASNFAQDLQSQRQGLQRQALQDLMGFSEMLLGQRPTEKFITPRKNTFLEDLGVSFSGGLGKGIGAAATGGWGG